MDTNLLYYGDNLQVLQDRIGDGTVDLVYIDPPFNSARDYFVIFKDRTGEDSQAQAEAFTDTWKWGSEDGESEATYRELVLKQPNQELRACVQALRTILGPSPMMAYLVAMAVRLIEIHRVLKSTGSFFLHCDPTASHYLKILLDSVFGPKQFRSEIIWKRSSAHNDAKQGRVELGRIHDVILCYSKSDKWKWNTVYTKYNKDYVTQFYKHVDANGRKYRLSDMTGPGGASKGNPYYEVMGVSRYWRFSKEAMNALIASGRVVQTKPGSVPQQKRYLDEMPGVPLQDIWDDISPIGPHAKERLGYPTQKPVELLKRIISMATDEGDVVLDAFCGCGTTVHAAHELGRRWVGIDITPVAVSVIKSRMEQTFDSLKVPVFGFPVDVEGARTLAADAPYEFQAWACALIGAYPRLKKGADGGIDGDLPFFDYKEQSQRAVVQVKGGKVSVNQIRDLVGTIAQEKAAIGFFICLDAPTKPMLTAATVAGFWDAGFEKIYPRIQILTIGDLLYERAYPRLPIQDKRSLLGFKAAKSERQTKQKAARFSTVNGQPELNLD